MFRGENIEVPRTAEQRIAALGCVVVRRIVGSNQGDDAARGYWLTFTDG